VTALNLITSCLIIIYSVKRIKANKYLDLTSIVSISYSMLYFLVPTIVFMFGQLSKSKYDLLGNIVYTSTTGTRIRIYIMCLLSYVLLMFPTIILKQKASKPQYSYRLNISALQQYATKFYYFTLIIGGIGFIGMTANLGVSGFVKFSGASRDNLNGTLETSRLFSYFNIFSKYLIAAIAPGIILYEINPSKKLKAELLIILTCSVLIELYNAGKSNFIMFLIPLIIYYTNKKSSINAKKIAVLGIVVIILVPAFDNLFYYLSRGESIEKYRVDWGALEYINSVSRQFVYPYANLVSSKAMNDYYGYRIFADYFAFINIIPAKLLGGFQVQTLYHLTTDYYQGQYGFTAGVPNDFVFLAYRQLGIIGVAILSFFRGIIIRDVDTRLQIVNLSFKKSTLNPMHLITCCSLISILITLIEPLSAFYSQPILFLSLIMIVIIRNKCLLLDENN